MAEQAHYELPEKLTGKVDVGRELDSIPRTKQKTPEHTGTHLIIQSELQYRTLVETMSDGLCLIGPDGLIKFVNNQFCEMTGYKKSDLTDRYTSEFLDRYNQKILRQHLDLPTEETDGQYELVLKRKDGKRITTIISPRPLFNADGKLEGSLAVIQDITERKRAEKEKENLLDELASKNQELQSIVSIASHDLKSPLITIEGFSSELEQMCKSLTEILLESSDEKTKKDLLPILEKAIPEDLRFIGASASKMGMLINGLLRVSHIGTDELTIEPLDMNLMMDDIIAAMKFHIVSTDTTVEIHDLPPCQGDTVMVNQVFSNLIDNALKYLDPDKKTHILISAKTEHNKNIYCVEDNGIGIAKQQHKKIFEVFHRLNPRSDISGEGLGLTIIRRILDRHNGHIHVESEPEKGSKFYVSIPANK